MFLPNDALKTVVYRPDSVMVPAVNKSFFFFPTKTKSTVNLKQSVTVKSKSTAT